MSTFFEHVVEQYPPDIRKKKYEYWQMLRWANLDYSKETGDATPEGFCKWMLEQWGLEVGVESGGYSPYYIVKNENRYLLFQLKYASK